jgi:hypothetical protein
MLEPCQKEVMLEQCMLDICDDIENAISQYVKLFDIKASKMASVCTVWFKTTFAVW